ncbi:MAG: Protein FdhD [Pseudomonadota bacterium]|jgi:FdhD protein
MSVPIRCLGVLLAGGESRRAGRDKAGIVFEGETLGARAVRTLDAVCDAVVVAGHGRGLDDSLPRLPDATPGIGPLAGVASAVAALAARAAADPSWRGAVALLLPVDMPRVDAATLLALRDAPRAGMAALLTPEGQVAPLPLRVDASAEAGVQAALAAGQRSLLGLCARLGVTLVPLPRASVGSLANWNDAARFGVAEPRPETHQAVQARRIGRQRDEPATELLAEEAPLQLRLATWPLAVLMRTPGDDLDLARGFVLTEGIVADPTAIAEVEHCEAFDAAEAEGHVVRVDLAQGVRVDPASLQRNTYVGSSCGVCGKASVERALATAPALGPRPVWPAAALVGLADRLAGAQPLFAATGGSHGAALFDRDGRLCVVREDVGRHNATDKVIGALAVERWPLAGMGLLVSGRISFELVQKALAAGIDLVVGVSAPTSLAIALGELAGVCVVGFARGSRMTVYTCVDRVDREGTR